MPTQPIIDSGQCTVITNNTYNTTGTLTRSLLKAATPTEVYAWYSNGTTWNPMASYLAHQFEMSMCGIRRTGFYDWIMSSVKDKSALWKPRSVGGGPSIIEPFIKAMQESVLNDESWTITAGYRCAGSGNSPFSDTGTTYTASSTGPLTGTPAINTGDRVIRVTPKYTLTPDAQYFIPGYKVVIQSLSSAGVTQTTVYRIVDAAHENATPPTYVDLLLKAETDNNASAWFNSAPTSGIARLAPPNINDYEAFCKNRINVNTKKLVPFWVQTTRQARKVSSEYEKVRASLLRDNQWFAKFIDLDEAARNRQDEIKYRREMVMAMLFQEAYSSNQTLSSWSSLPQITSVSSGITVDPGTGGQLVAYRANMVGVLPQLRACGQALDYLNTPLNPKTWCETYLYPLYRARKSGDRPADSIDVYTDSDTAAQFEVAMVDWYKDRFGADAQIQINADLKTGENAEFGFKWRSFRIPTKPTGVVVNIIVNEAFDDLKDALGSTYEQAGRYLWTCDFGGGIYPAMVASNHKTHTVGQLNDLSKVDSTYACVMENPTERVSMTSTTMTMIVECPLQSRVDYGFSSITYTP